MATVREGWFLVKAYIHGEFSGNLIYADENDVTLGQWVRDPIVNEVWMIDEYPRIPMSGEKIYTDYQNLVVREVMFYSTSNEEIDPGVDWVASMECDVINHRSIPYDRLSIIKDQLETDLGSDE